jgi:hypothetical protein
MGGRRWVEAGPKDKNLQYKGGGETVWVWLLLLMWAVLFLMGMVSSD